MFISEERSDEAIQARRVHRLGGDECASLGGGESASLGGHGALRHLAMTIV